MRSLIRVAVVVAAAAFPLVGLATNTQAAPKPKPAATPQIMVTCSPNPVVETGTSLVQTVCQVEANPSFAGKTVTISSTQLNARCTGVSGFGTLSSGAITPSINLILDNDGNATAFLLGVNCASGSMLIDASLDSPPFSTGITKLVVEPPQVTAPGVHAFPNPEVEVGDNLANAAPNNTESEAYFVFYVETNPVYAEQAAELTSDQLTERCQVFIQLANVAGVIGPFTPPAGTTVNTGKIAGKVAGIIASGPIDNDGNTVFSFAGSSCAAGKSTVIAEILAGGPTYSTQVTILPPAVTI
jgi:hypothetical protein